MYLLEYVEQDKSKRKKQKKGSGIMPRKERANKIKLPNVGKKKKVVKKGKMKKKKYESEESSESPSDSSDWINDWFI